jgi:hypothetical protein
MQALVCRCVDVLTNFGFIKMFILYHFIVKCDGTLKEQTLFTIIPFYILLNVTRLNVMAPEKGRIEAFAEFAYYVKLNSH